MLTEWREAATRHVPDVGSLLTAGRESLGPAAGTALLVFAAGLLVTRKKGAVPAGAPAMIAAVGVANYLHPVLKWWPELDRDPDRPLFPRFRGQHLLLFLFLLAQIDGVLARSDGVPGWGKWRLRLGLGLVAAIFLVPAGLHTTWPQEYAQWPYPFRAWAWPLAAFTLAVALGWAGSAKAAQQAPGGAVGFGLAAALFGASIVILHGHTASVAEAITIPAAALVGIAIASAIAKVEVTGALPGLCVMLPACLLIGATEADSEVPSYAFALAGLPPLTIGLMALPPLTKMTGIGRHLVFWVLCLGPTIAALILAVRAESLPVINDNGLSAVPLSLSCRLT